MSSRRKLLSAISAFLLVSAAAGAIAQVRIATVDLHQAIMDTTDGQRARRRLEGEFSNRQRELDGAQEELRRMQSEIESQRNVLSPAALNTRMEAYQARVIEVQRQFVEYQQELAQHEAALTRRIVERMQAILREMGQTDGYTVILDTSTGAVVWAPTTIDLTATLVQRYNAAPATGAAEGDGEGDTAMADGETPAMTTPAMTTPAMTTPAMTTPAMRTGSAAMSSATPTAH